MGNPVGQVGKVPQRGQSWESHRAGRKPRQGSGFKQWGPAQVTGRTDEDRTQEIEEKTKSQKPED